MEVKVNNKVKRSWNQKEWTPEMDAVINRLADGETTISEIAVAIDKETGSKVSRTLLRKHMHAMGAPMRAQGGKIQITQEMRDFVYVKAKKGKTIAEIQECECKDAIASLIRKTNAILSALRAVGIIATE